MYSDRVVHFFLIRECRTEAAVGAGCVSRSSCLISVFRSRDSSIANNNRQNGSHNGSECLAKAITTSAYALIAEDEHYIVTPELRTWSNRVSTKKFTTTHIFVLKWDWVFASSCRSQNDSADRFELAVSDNIYAELTQTILTEEEQTWRAVDLMKAHQTLPIASGAPRYPLSIVNATPVSPNRNSMVSTGSHTQKQADGSQINLP